MGSHIRAGAIGERHSHPIGRGIAGSVGLPTLLGQVHHQSRDEEERVIESRPGPVSFGLLALWSHRELLWIFLKRQISIRYRQMVLGVLWGLIEPLGLLLMMVAVFGWLLRVDSNGYPYPVFAFAALVPWQFFSKGTTAAGDESLRKTMGAAGRRRVEEKFPIGKCVSGYDELYRALLMGKMPIDAPGLHVGND